MSEGRVVGRYELLELLGRGGMGEVWRARDPGLDRVVALKLLQRTTPEDILRFRREAHAIAQLSHPGIAQLYEFSADPPYLAMQFIDGEPIARPEHLAQAARAVETAHDKGILHRDLKPANILVDRAGRAFVLDFGLAREVKAEATGLTLTGDIVGTPSFMSPEQARGDVRALDARTDVYGLGATLYALLMGRPPHTGPTAYDVVRSVLEEDPALPPGELGIIAMKALEKDPARRYASAGAMADDLDRYLRREPILARPPSTLYRLGKRIRRNPVAWGLAATLVFAIAGLGGFGLVQLARAKLNLERALQEETRRRETESAASERLQARELLERTGRRLRELNEELSRDVGDSRLEEIRRELQALAAQMTDEAADRPEEGASLLWLRGEAHLMLSLDSEAESDFTASLEAPEGAWGQAMSVRTMSRFGRARARLASFQDMLVEGASQSLNLFSTRGRDILPPILEDLDAAGAGAAPGRTLQEARLWGRFLRADFEGTLATLHDEVEAGGRSEGMYFLMGLCLEALGRPGDAATAYTTSLNLHRGRPRVWFHRARTRTDAADPAGAEHDLTRAIRLKPDYVEALNNRGIARLLLGNPQGAREDFERGIQLRPDDAQLHLNLATVHRDTGNPREALPLYDEAIRLDPEYADAFFQRGSLRRELGDPGAAITDLTEAARLSPRDSRIPTNRSNAYFDLGDDAAGLADLEAAMAVAPDDPYPYYNRGNYHFAHGDRDRALADWTEAIRRKPDFADAYSNRGNLLRSMGDTEGAMRDLDECVRLDPNLVNGRINRGILLRRLERFEEALVDFDAACRLAPDNFENFRHRGVVYHALGRLQEALADLERSLQMSPDDRRAASARQLADQIRAQMETDPEFR